MKKKGFTLVELLAVIAILAILVIVAMPNVLGRFNQAKSNVFVRDVQAYMDAAKTSFVADSMSSTGARVYSNEIENASKLSMDGAEKHYIIEFDTYGKFTKVIIWDSNYCYDATKATAGFNSDTFDKTSVKEEDVYVGAATKDESGTYACGTDKAKKEA